MELYLALVIGALYAMGFYLLLRRSLVRLLFGIMLLGNAANLLIFAASGLVPGRPPLIPDGATTVAGPVADPLPQALILTAIVIGFGVLAFAIVLVRRAYRLLGTDDLDALKGREP